MRGVTESETGTAYLPPWSVFPSLPDGPVHLCGESFSLGCYHGSELGNALTATPRIVLH